MSTRFSIIIPVYNVAPYLRECLDSVLAQTFADWEAICVDDGSTDGSGAILDEYAAKDSRFRVIHQRNAGVSAARNEALKKAQGEYIAFVDADDAVVPSWLQYASNLLSPKCDVGMMSCRHWHGESFVNAEQTKVVCYETREQVLNFFSKHVYGFTPFLFFCRRGILEGLSFDTRLRRDEDVAFFSLVFLQANSLITSDFGGYKYRQREDSADHMFVTDGDVAKFIDIAIENYRNVIRDEKDRFCYREWLSSRIICDLIAHIRKSSFYPQKTIGSFRRAVRAGAFDFQSMPVVRRMVAKLIYFFGPFARYMIIAVVFLKSCYRRMKND